MPKTRNQLYITYLLVLFGLLGCTLSYAVQFPKAANVSRAMVTTAIENREPVNRVLILSNKTYTVYFFTDLRHFENQKIIHRWEYDGEVISEKTFDVSGPRWRVYSKLTLPADKLGTWTVVVSNEKGWPLKAVIFKYVAGDESDMAILPVE